MLKFHEGWWKSSSVHVLALHSQCLLDFEWTLELAVDAGGSQRIGVLKEKGVG